MPLLLPLLAGGYVKPGGRREEANRQVLAHTSSVSVDERDGDVVSAKYKYGTL